jgi:hypothetical protein
MIMDLYGIDTDLPDEPQCVGRVYFARSPGYGFFSTISPRRSIPLYGRGIDESLRFQQDYRSCRKANDTVF